MNIKKDKYIIVELIPTSIDPIKGDIVQLSALKLNGLVLEDKLDYRLNIDKIKIKDLIDLISYDKENFVYKETSQEIMKSFQNFSEDLPILFIENSYTENYLKYLNNKKESILKYLNLTYNDSIIDFIINKYNLQPSNYIVDLLYEALIQEYL